MSLTSLEKAVLAFLAGNSAGVATYRSLTTIFEELSEPTEKRATLFDEFDPNDDDKEALRSVLDEMVLDGLLEAKMDEREYERSYRLTDQGVYEATLEDAPLVYQGIRPEDVTSSSHLSEPTLTAQDSEDRSVQGGGLFDPDIFDPAIFDTGKKDDSKNAAKSESWTGSQFGYVNIAVVREPRIQVKELHTLAHRLNYESAADEKDLKGLADALLALSDMAEPDISLVVRILAHPKFKIYGTLFAAAATVRGALGI